MLGAACTKTEDAQSATGTVTMLVFIGYFASMMITSNDKAIVSTVASLVPPVSFFTAPILSYRKDQLANLCSITSYSDCYSSRNMPALRKDIQKADHQ